MAEKTTYYGLVKPSPDDYVNVEQLNENTDKIDLALHEKIGFGRRLTALGDDPNGLTEPGFYTVNGKTAGWEENSLPQGVFYGILFVFPEGGSDTRAQWLISSDKTLYYRIMYYPNDYTYGSWVRLFDDDDHPERSAASVSRLNSALDGLSQSVASMGQSLSQGISAIGERTDGLQSQNTAVMAKINAIESELPAKWGYVRALGNGSEDDPNALTQSGMYAFSSRGSGWGVSLPDRCTGGFIEVFDVSGAGIKYQRLTTTDGELYYRIRDDVHGYDWGAWKQIQTV